MSDPRASNLLGALAVALGDDISAATEGVAGHAAASPAAIVTVGGEPGQTIESLRRALELSHSGTVRLLDRLEDEGIVERREGKDGRSAAIFLTTRDDGSISGFSMPGVNPWMQPSVTWAQPREANSCDWWRRFCSESLAVQRTPITSAGCANSTYAQGRLVP